MAFFLVEEHLIVTYEVAFFLVEEHLMVGGCCNISTYFGRTKL